MRATASARIRRVHDRDEVVERRAESPVAIRSSGGRVLIASTAATPVGGDEIVTHVEIGPGATASVGSVAAMVVWPAPDGAWSTWRTCCEVGAAGHLDLAPEPTVSVAGSRHRSVTRVRLAADATCRIVEEVSLGRTGEPSGELQVSLRVDRGGAVLVHHDETFGTGDSSTSVGVGAARHVLTAVVVGVTAGDPRTVVEPGRAASRMPVASDAVVVMAVGADRPSVRSLVAEVAPEALVSDRR